MRSRTCSNVVSEKGISRNVVPYRSVSYCCMDMVHDSELLAGFCALLPYPEDNAAEIVGLYTITRFQGEGIGGRLVATLIAEGEQRGFSYLFASTIQEGAQRLFERHEFRRVAPEDVAAAKWQGYDPERKRHVIVYRRELLLRPTRFGTPDK